MSYLASCNSTEEVERLRHNGMTVEEWRAAGGPTLTETKVEPPLKMKKRSKPNEDNGKPNEASKEDAKK